MDWSKILRVQKIYIFAIILVSIIHFYLYNHFWFLKLFGWNIYDHQKNVVFLLVLFFLAMIYQLTVWIKLETERKISNVGKQLIIPLFLYFAFGIFVVILHEQGFDAIKRYLFYLFTPVMVSVSIFAIFRNNGNIKKALFVLFLLGVIFSIYSTMLHVKMKTDFVSVYSILDPDGKNAAGMSLEYLSRHSIPGLGVNNLESMLIAPLLIGFYYVMKSNRRMIKYFCILAISFLFYNMAICGSRGAFLSLVCGMVYLYIKRFFASDKIAFSGVMLIFTAIIFITETLLLRYLLTIYQFFPSIADIDVIGRLIEKGHYGGYAIAGIGEKEARVDFLLNTVQVIKDNPVVGSGFTNLDTSQQLIFKGGGEHNAYLSIFAQGGMVIFIPLMAFAFLIYFNSEKSQRLYADSPSKDLGVLLTAIFLSYFVDQFFTPGFFHRHWIWFGFVAAWARNCEMEHQMAAKALRVEATKD
jgi:hypothetical protein